jgi:hypothetical protein
MDGTAFPNSFICFGMGRASASRVIEIWWAAFRPLGTFRSTARPPPARWLRDL